MVMTRCRHNMLEGTCAWCTKRTLPPRETTTDPDFLEWARDGGEGSRHEEWHAAHERELRALSPEEVAALTTAERHALWERLALRFGRSRSAVWQRWYILTGQQRREVGRAS